jgi:hypothetical protein
VTLADDIEKHSPKIVALNAPKILTIDIETSPNLAHVWGLWDQNVGLSQLLESGQVICFAAKWYGTRSVEFYSDHHHGHTEMVKQAHRLMTDADIIVHYNGKRFDIPHLKREFVEAGMTPPSPHRDVDLLQVVKSQFRFPSNKLDYVAGRLLGVNKVGHTGHRLWLDCVVKNDPRAWALMKRYCIGDVKNLTEPLYDRLRGWIPNHPHIGLWSGEEKSCDRCGSTDLQFVGKKAATTRTLYAEAQCRNCGGWLRNGHRERIVTVVPAR